MRRLIRGIGNTPVLQTVAEPSRYQDAVVSHTHEENICRHCQHSDCLSYESGEPGQLADIRCAHAGHSYPGDVGLSDCIDYQRITGPSVTSNSQRAVVDLVPEDSLCRQCSFSPRLYAHSGEDGTPGTITCRYTGYTTDINVPVRECSAYYTYSTPHPQRAVVDDINPGSVCSICSHARSLRRSQHSPSHAACHASGYFITLDRVYATCPGNALDIEL